MRVWYGATLGLIVSRTAIARGEEEEEEEDTEDEEGLIVCCWSGHAPLSLYGVLLV